VSNRMVRVAALSLFFVSMVLAGTPGTLKWSYPAWGCWSPAVGPDGTVYIGAYWHDSLFAINPNGTRKWAMVPGYCAYSSPIVGSDGTVYVGDADGVSAIKPNGKLKWWFRTGWVVYSTPAIGSDGTVYVGSGNHVLYAINPNGALRWKFMPGYASSNPAVATDGTIYIVGGDSCIYAVNPSGTLKWSHHTDGNWHSPAIGSDGTIYVGSSSVLYAFRPDGTIKWSRTFGPSTTDPAIAADGTIYICSGGYLRAYKASGSLKWSYPAGNDGTAPAIAADGTIYVHDDGVLHAVNSDGTHRWDYETSDESDWSAPAIGSDGTVYVGENDKLLAIYGSAPLANSPWPKFHHDNRNTGWVGGPQTRIVRVKNDGNPVARCSVYVNGVAQQSLTDSRGEVRIENLRQNDMVWAKKKVYTEPAVKPGHEDVDNTMYELWMDTKTLQKSGSKWDWQPYKVSGTVGDIDLNLAHALFKWNLVATVGWSVGSGQEPQIADYFSFASDYLLDVTDGQMMLGKVAVYDDWDREEIADVVFDEGVYQASTNFPALFSLPLNIWLPFFGIRSPLGLGGQIEMGDDFGWSPPLGQTLIHEFGHYALGFYDEYENILHQQVHRDWTYRDYSNSTEFPDNYGLMDRERLDREMSGSYLYLESYPPDPAKEAVTEHFCKWGMPCWEALKRGFEGNYSGIVVTLTRAGLSLPRYSYWDPEGNPPGPVDNTRRDGPDIAEGCEVVFETHSQETGHSAPLASSVRPSSPVAMRSRMSPDTIPPGCVAGIQCTGDTSFTLELSVWVDESLPQSPTATVYPIKGESIRVDMTRTPAGYFHGFAAVGGARRGTCLISMTDTAANVGVSNYYYKVHYQPAWTASEFSGGDGHLALSLPESACAVARSFCALSQFGAAPIAPPSLQVVGSVQSFGSSENDSLFSDSVSVVIYYGDEDVSGKDETSVQLYYWQPDGATWALVPSTCVPGENELYSRIGRFGTYAAFAQPSLDTVSPMGVNSLLGSAILRSRRVFLRWSATGDDSSSGRATAYDIRFSQSPITPSAWDSCLAVAGEPIPSPAGDTDSMVVSVPEPDTPYYFALKTSDEAGNVSALSNVVSVVAATPPPIPGGNLPVNRSYLKDATPEFWWDSTWTDTGFYRLQLARNPQFTQGLVTFDSLDTITVTVPDSMALDEGAWYWRVAAYDTFGNTYGYQEPSYQFTVDVTAPAAPVLCWPADSQVVGSRKPWLIWTASGGNWGHYLVQLSHDSLFSDTLGLYPNIYDTAYWLQVALPESTTLVYWRVQATDGAGNVGGISARSRFIVDTMIPPTPLQVLPYDGDMVYDSTPSLVWTNVAADTVLKLGIASFANFSRSRPAGPVTYRLQISLNDSFLPCVVETSGIGDTTFTVPDSLSFADTTFYWRVEAIDSSDRHSGFLPKWWFIVEARADITGNVTYYSNSRPVPGVKLVAEGRTDTTETGQFGGYAVTNLPMFQDYTVAPLRREPSRQVAVTAYDAFLVLTHALHRDTLDSMQFIAADVTGDSTISAFDAQRILEYAVARRSHFPVGARTGGDTVDWVFMPSSRSYDSVWENQTDQDYEGIMYGDPSGNWPGNQLLAAWTGTAGVGGVTCFDLNMPSSSGGTSVEVQRAQATVLSGRPRDLQQVAATPTRIERPKDEYMFAVVAKKARDAVSADIMVRYDAGRYTLRGVRTSDQTDGFMVAATDYKGLVRISMAGTRKLDGDVTLLELAFEPAAGAVAQAPGLKPQAPATKPGTTLNSRSQETAPTIVAMSREPSAAGGERSADIGEPSAVSREPLAEIVWLVLNEGQSPPGLAAEDGAMGDKKDLPATFFLAAPRPNPFGEGTCIGYGLPIATRVSLNVYDVTGRVVRSLMDRELPAGSYTTVWDGKDARGRQLSNGIYFIRMQTDNQQFQRKVTLVQR